MKAPKCFNFTVDTIAHLGCKFKLGLHRGRYEMPIIPDKKFVLLYFNRISVERREFHTVMLFIAQFSLLFPCILTSFFNRVQGKCSSRVTFCFFVATCWTF